MEKKKRNTFITGGIMLVAAICRIGLANWLGIWFPCAQVYDDALLVRYADLTSHFNEPNIDSLLKYLGYPVYLNAVSKTPFSYATVTAGVWILAAVCVFFVAKRLTGNKVFSLVAYLYTLYLPVAFDLYCGTRLYRNAIIAPFACISLTCMGWLILYIKDDKRSIVKSILLGILTGVSFTWCYYMKEDGIWLKACLLFTFLYAGISFLVCLIRKRQRNLRAVVSALLLAAIPVLIYKYTTIQYMNKNYESFGVYDLNTRTEGQLGEFVNSVYKIKSENRTADVWAPYDAIVQAFEASPTLSEHPELLQAVHDSPWRAGNVEENPINGDFLTWVLRTALDNTHIWEDEKQISDLFGKVNKEIQTAFDDGRLQKETDRIQLLGSAGGRTIPEILDLFPLVVESFKGVIVQKGVQPGCLLVGPEEIEGQPELCEAAAELTHTEYLTDYSFRFNTVLRATAFCRVLTMIYMGLNLVLFLGSVGIILFQIFVFLVHLGHMKKYRKERGATFEKTFMALVMYGVACVYAFGICWFSSFLGEQALVFLNYYNIALPCIMTLAYLLSWSSLFGNKIKRKNKGEN